MVKVIVVGLGYIGLPTALLFAKAGHSVTGIDTNEKTVESLNAGKLTFTEPGLDELFEDAKDNFRATGSFESIKNSDAILVCVPTPLKDGKMDDTYLRSAAKAVGEHLTKDSLAVLESTVTPGTTRGLFREILESASGLKAGADFCLAFCPERAMPGNTLHEMVHNDRIIGGFDEVSAEKAKTLYSTMVKGKLYLTNPTVAEMAKVTENTFRDINIALANELSRVAEELGIDIFEVIELSNKHPRVNIHQPGLGVGGHCLPIDPLFLVDVYSKAKLIPTAREINDEMPLQVGDIILNANVKSITILGAAYKPNVDDIRESPSLELKEYLEKHGVEVGIYDPIVYPEQSLESTLSGSQGVVLATAHNSFKDIDWARICELLESPKLLIDGRHFFSQPPAGFKFYGIGRGDVN
jgi:UDP-N-acetyl-D-mannosaminuronic acid dehydrogenase